MEKIPPVVMKIAREFLGLSQDEVAAILKLARSTIQRIERGAEVTPIYLQTVRRFYEDQGIVFLTPSSAEGWGLRNVNVTSKGDRLNQLASIPTSRRRTSEE